MAATAAGQLLYPFRTQKISLPAFHTVLKCASLRELWHAAMSTLIYSLFSNKFISKSLYYIFWTFLYFIIYSILYFLSA